jgi:transposase
VADLDQAIGRRYGALDHYLRTIPGLGQATAPAIYAESGDIRRFTDSDQLVAVVGVDPQLQTRCSVWRRSLEDLLGVGWTGGCACGHGGWRV